MLKGQWACRWGQPRATFRHVIVSREELDGPDARQVHVVPHTHWDREWYHLAARFRQPLVALVDALLAYPDGPFLLDGQAITVRDYLAVRPERLPALQTALREGRLEAGPWFVLADNLIPSGEAIVRNLDAGRRVLSSLGATAPPVAYCPDTFGHPAALPTIAAGFGLQVAVVWRGAGGAGHPATDRFQWQAPDGTPLLTYHLPPDGYEFGSALPVSPEQATERWARLQALWEARGTGPVALLLNGADHHARQPDLPAALAALQLAAGSTGTLKHTTLAAWAEALRAAAAGVALPTVHGELRDSYGYTWTLAGTYATRAHQKRRNARLERGLLRDVEPWLALARLHGAPADVAPTARLSPAQFPALLQRAWDDLLSTHPHDTLCGCSVDAVARAMDVQQESVAAQGQGLRDAALQWVLGHDPVRARADTNDFDWRRLVLRNRVPRARGGVAVVTLRETLAHEPVGPGSAAPSAVIASGGPLDTGAMLWQPLASRVVSRRRESPQHYPDNDRVREQRGLLWVPPVPASGLDAWDAARWTEPPPPPPMSVTAERTAARTTLRNGRLVLEVDHQARAVSLQIDDRRLAGLLSLETRADGGDSYTPSLRGRAESLRCVGARLVASGPLRATVRLWWQAGAATSRPGPAGRLRVVTDLSLDAMSPVLRCDVRGWSRRTDHRLQLVWHTDVIGGTVWADAAFGPVARTTPVAPPHAQESVPATMPMHRWAMHATPMFGATLIADGLAEAEVGDGRLALTLVRGVGQLSRNDLPERPGHAGWPSPTPEAQSLGAFAARTALLLHGPLSDDVLARVRDACDEVLLPLIGESWRDLKSAGRHAGLEVVGEAFELTACTLSAVDEAAVVLRVVNNTTRSAWGTVRFPDDGPWLVTRCRLDEEPLAPPETVGRALTFEAGPRAVVTFRIRRPTPVSAT